MNNELFEDFVLCFFGRKNDLDNAYWRNYFLYGDSDFTGYMEAFPTNEICEAINERMVEQSCGCCFESKYTNANYIEEAVNE